jgi:hypothetical protein
MSGASYIACVNGLLERGRYRARPARPALISWFVSLRSLIPAAFGAAVFFFFVFDAVAVFLRSAVFDFGAVFFAFEPALFAPPLVFLLALLFFAIRTSLLDTEEARNRLMAIQASQSGGVDTMSDA